MSNPTTAETPGFWQRCLRARRFGARPRPTGAGRWRLGLGVLLAGACTLVSLAQHTNRPGRPDASEFRVIADRNIFNPHRYYHAPGTSYRPPTARRDSFTLVGTMTGEQEPLAFFEGTRSDFQKVLKPAGTIAGYTVADITPAAVKLVSGTNAVELAVGMRMRSQGEGSWRAGRSEAPTVGPPLAPGARPTVVTEEAADDSGSATNGEGLVMAIDPTSQPVADVAPDAAETNTNADAAAGSAIDDPVLRRLKQRRQQEMNQ